MFKYPPPQKKKKYSFDKRPTLREEESNKGPKERRERERAIKKQY